jgi:hypothetical protein
LALPWMPCGGRGDPTSGKPGHAVARGDPGNVCSNGTSGVPALVVQHSDNVIIPPAKGKYIAEHIPAAKYVELPGRN